MFLMLLLKKYHKLRDQFQEVKLLFHLKEVLIMFQMLFQIKLLKLENLLQSRRSLIVQLKLKMLSRKKSENNNNFDSSYLFKIYIF